MLASQPSGASRDVLAWVFLSPIVSAVFPALTTASRRHRELPGTRSQARAVLSRRRHLTASLLVLLLVCAPLVGCSLGADQSGLGIPGFNPSATSNSDQTNAQAALDYLTPDGELTDGRWVPGKETAERWARPPGTPPPVRRRYCRKALVHHFPM
ncbi:hypothetical protein DRB06_14865 [Actinomyces sp. Z5]|nr:hypothetical protein DRB06_14865 [Actinomyces sp. Z5]